VKDDSLRDLGVLSADRRSSSRSFLV